MTQLYGGPLDGQMFGHLMPQDGRIALGLNRAPHPGASEAIKGMQYVWEPCKRHPESLGYAVYELRDGRWVHVETKMR